MALNFTLLHREGIYQGPPLALIVEVLGSSWGYGSKR